VDKPVWPSKQLLQPPILIFMVQVIDGVGLVSDGGVVVIILKS
jgi:hypothetical protein